MTTDGGERMASGMGMAGELNVRQLVRPVVRRGRWLVRLHDVSWFVTFSGLAALGLGSLDYWLRFEDPGVRLICSILLALVILRSGYWFLWRGGRWRCSDLEAAWRIEQRFPALGNLVSSAVAFDGLTENDETAGSWELRRAVMAQAAAAMATVDGYDCLNHRRPLWGTLAATAVTATILTLCLASPATMVLAARRLTRPLGADAWPRRHELVFTTAPTRIAAGQDFEVELTDAKGHLPDVVQIHYGFEGDDASSVETHTMQPLGDRLTHRLTHVTRPFRYRATGGDDQRMAWHELQVMEPPRMLVHDLHLTPPAYTGLPSTAATGHFRALQGTRVGVRLRVSKPLRDARLETTTMDPSVASLPMRLDEDLLGATLESSADATWEIGRSGAYWFRFVDQDDLDSGAEERWDVAAIPDLPPVVTMRQPAADLPLTARAQVTLEAQVKDDLAIRSMALQFQLVRGGVPGDVQRTELWSGPEQVSPAAPAADAREDGVQRTVTHDWDLALIPDLEPGTYLEYRLVASDYRPQEGAGPARRITILSPEEHDERLMQRQAEILAQIAEVARMQEQNGDQIRQLATQLRTAQQLERGEVDQLQGAELNQRQIQQRLMHPADGLAAQVAELLRDFERNRVDNPTVRQQLEQLGATLQTLGDAVLAHIERQLLAALKAARDVVRDDAPEQPAGMAADARSLSERLSAIQADQTEVMRTLEQLLDALTQWDDMRRLTRDAGRLRRDQEEVRQRTDQLRAATLSKDVRELSDDRQAELSRLAEHQQTVARRWDAWAERLRAADSRLADAATDAATPLAAARQRLDQLAIGGDLRDAARDIAANRLGQAIERQDETIRQLEQIQRLLAQRGAASHAEMADRVQSLRAEIPQLLARQQRLEQQTRELDLARPSRDANATDAWRATLAELTHEQAAVEEAVGGLERGTADIASLAFVFQAAAEAAAEANRRLRAEETGSVTWSWQQQVRSELQQVLAVLAESATPATDPDAPSGATESAEDAPQESDPALLLQLKVVRTLQQEVNQRTTALDATVRLGAGWDAQQVQVQQGLARRQDALADVLMRLSASPGGAAEPLPSGPPAAPGSPPRPPAQGANPLDQQLLDDLPPSGAGGVTSSPASNRDANDTDSAADPLPRIAGRMRDVARQVRRREIAQPTHVAQRQILETLTELIESLAARQSASGAAKTLADRAQRPAPHRDDQMAAGRQAAQDAAPPTGDDLPAAADAADVTRAVQDLWGQLPERYRRQVQNVDTVEFLPAYRTLIEDYYRRLAERRERRP